MGNTISLSRPAGAGADSLRMSNGLTEVFIDVLALSGSVRAATLRERELTAWLAARDQTIYGRGVVGFALSQMPWTPAGFAAERNFLLQAISGAAARSGWDQLAYTPNEAWLLPALSQFSALLARFAPEHIDPALAAEWQAELTEHGIYPSFPACPKHQVLLHPYGCVICHYDTPLATDTAQ